MIQNFKRALVPGDNYLNILVVEDSGVWQGRAQEMIAEYIAKTSSFSGYNLYIAETASEGLYSFVNFKPAITLTDVNFDLTDEDNMEGITGFLLPLRRHDQKAKVICWSSDSKFRNDALKYAQVFVEKKEKPEKTLLVEALEKLLS